MKTGVVTIPYTALDEEPNEIAHAVLRACIEQWGALRVEDLHVGEALTDVEDGVLVSRFPVTLATDVAACPLCSGNGYLVSTNEEGDD